MSKPFNRDAFRFGLAEIREAMPDIAQSIALNAQLARMKYAALIKEGFSESQALELCRTNSPLT